MEKIDPKHRKNQGLGIKNYEYEGRGGKEAHTYARELPTKMIAASRVARVRARRRDIYTSPALE